MASECYCHFTSPIRRYPDLTVHRLVDAPSLAKAKPRNDYEELVALGRHCSDREQRAEAAERELTKLKLLAYLSDRIGEEMDAVVTGVESYGIFVQGIKLPGRRAGPRGNPQRRLLPLRPRHAHVGRPSRRQSVSGSAICSALPWRGLIWNAASWISAWWNERRPGGKSTKDAKIVEKGKKKGVRRSTTSRGKRHS